MRRQQSNQGFAGVEALLILVLVAIVAFAGYKVYQTRNNTNKLNDQSASQQVAVPKTSVPTAITNSSDLDKASTALNADNPDDNSADVSALDTQSNF